MKTLPIKYHLEIYERSFINHATASFESDSPFMAISKGDYVDPGMWNDRIDAPPVTWFKVTEVVHRVWEIGSSHIGHQVGICIVPADRPS